jgi:serine protease Do
VEQAKSSVVNIHGRKAVRTDQRQLTSVDSGRQVNGMGTGIIIDERGYMLTNFHVVDGVTQIKVTMADQRTVVATLVAHDPTTDLAVIKIKGDVAAIP